MNNKANKILTVLGRLALVYCMLKINSLSNEINSLRRQLSGRQNSLQQQIGNIHQNVDSQLKRQLDVLEESSLDVISGDTESMTAVLLYTAKPKVFSPSTTRLTVTVDGVDHRMEYVDGKYQLQLTVPLIHNNLFTGITLTDGDTVRYQTLYQSINAKNNFILDIRAGLSGQWTCSTTGKCSIDSTLHISASGRDNGRIASVELVQVTDGAEVMRKAVEKGEPFKEEEALFYKDLKMDLQVPKNSTTYLYADVTDGDGYIHRCLLEKWQIDSNGRVMDDDEYYPGEKEAAVEIYRSDGELVYRYDPEEWEY